MVKLYVRMIKTGRMTLDEVPAKWHDAVEEALKEDGYLKSDTTTDTTTDTATSTGA